MIFGPFEFPTIPLLQGGGPPNVYTYKADLSLPHPWTPNQAVNLPGRVLGVGFYWFRAHVYVEI